MPKRPDRKCQACWHTFADHLRILRGYENNERVIVGHHTSAGYCSCKEFVEKK